MLTVLIVLGLIKMSYDQWKQDKWFKKFPIEDFDKETYNNEEPPDF